MVSGFVKNIRVYEDTVQAFVEGTFDPDRVIDQFDKQQNKYGHLPLAGSLLGVKDIIDAEDFGTRCGSNLPVDLLTGLEASCVSKLKRAGAIVAGKTVTAEFAVTEPGPTRNPHKLSCTPGGSSSGSAAGVAAGFFDIALGSQTGGSVIRPAAYCGIYGFKSSHGRVPMDGVFPYSETCDHLGVFVSKLSKLEKVLKVIDPIWQSENACAPDTIRLGIPEGAYLDLADELYLKHFEEVVELLVDRGFNITRHQILGNIVQLNDLLDMLTCAEMYRVHQHWYDQYADVYKPQTKQRLKIGKSVSNQELLSMKLQAGKLRSVAMKKMFELGVDFWLAPAATSVAPTGLGNTGNHHMNAIWSLTGFPVVAVPSGRNVDGLPYGLQIIGPYGSDEKLLNAAKLVDKVIDARLRPAFRN